MNKMSMKKFKWFSGFGSVGDLKERKYDLIDYLEEVSRDLENPYIEESKYVSDRSWDGIYGYVVDLKLALEWNSIVDVIQVKVVNDLVRELVKCENPSYIQNLDRDEWEDKLRKNGLSWGADFKIVAEFEEDGVTKSVVGTPYIDYPTFEDGRNIVEDNHESRKKWLDKIYNFIGKMDKYISENDLELIAKENKYWNVYYEWISKEGYLTSCTVKMNDFGEEMDKEYMKDFFYLEDEMRKG